MAQARFIDAISEVSAQDWDRLYPGDYPFTRHAFLDALERSGCVDEASGWTPRHLLLESRDGLAAALPLYIKGHSYGEFVFDWGWAAAFDRLGLAYYPKLLSAIPFTPAQGPRLGIAPGVAFDRTVDAMCRALGRETERLGASGWHLLFPEPAQAGALRELEQRHAILRRHDVQFHWHSRGESSFDGFLSRLKSSRRKTIRRERRRVREQGITLHRLTGTDITAQAWDLFHACYVRTYRKRSGHEGYLNRACFDALLGTLGEQMLLVLAEEDGAGVASALFLFDEHTLYGRYWGALAERDCLHFECCFYQGIEFAIDRGLTRFDPGAQGEHKLLRGFEPVQTCSFHHLRDQRMHVAVDRFLQQERAATRRYREQAEAFLPFRRVD